MLAIALYTPPALVVPIVDETQDRAISASIVSVVAGPLKHMRNPQLMFSAYTPFQFPSLGLRITQVSFIAGALNQYQLDKINIVVLRRNDIYFDRAQLGRNDPRGADTRQARARIDLILSGHDKEFQPCGASAVATVLCRRTDYTASGA